MISLLEYQYHDINIHLWRFQFNVSGSLSIAASGCSFTTMKSAKGGGVQLVNNLLTGFPESQLTKQVLTKI